MSTSKTIKKRREAMRGIREQWLLNNGDFAGIDPKGLEKTFPNIEDRLNYIQALIDDFSK